jgi:hypothetical protein
VAAWRENSADELRSLSVQTIPAIGEGAAAVLHLGAVGEQRLHLLTACNWHGWTFGRRTKEEALTKATRGAVWTIMTRPNESDHKQRRHEEERMGPRLVMEYGHLRPLRLHSWRGEAPLWQKRCAADLSGPPQISEGDRNR